MYLRAFFLQGMQKFFDSVIQAIIRHVNFDVVKCVLLASPGFIKDQLFDYMMQWATKMDEKKILDNRSKFVLAHCSSGFKHSVKGSSRQVFIVLQQQLRISSIISMVLSVF
jgi:stalled ribosome rescue protein Dom34